MELGLNVDFTLSKLYLFKRFMLLSYSDACEAYSALEKHDEDSKYIIALGYLTMSQQSHIELIKAHCDIGLDHREIDKYMTAYEAYTFQLKQVITDKDTNTSWLSSTHDSLIDAWKSTDAFIEKWTNTLIQSV